MKQKILIGLAIALPFLVIGLAVGIVYLPYLYTEEPQYDFIYSNDRCFDYQPVRIEGDELVAEPRDYDRCEEFALYYHDVSEDRSIQISVEESNTYDLDKSITSPDGFVLRDEYGGGSPFSSGSQRYILVKDGVSFEQELVDRYDNEFVAWVIN
jgi:hypothetical protein